MAALFPPQSRDWALPAECDLSPHAAERVCREAATKSFDDAARSLNRDWGVGLDGKPFDVAQGEVQRWSEALGRGMVAERDREARARRQGDHPDGPANDPQLLVVGLDGGRYQARDADPETGSRWREDKVATVTTYVPGDGRDGEGARKPAPLVTTCVATAGDAAAAGLLARAEAERRGYRGAATVIGMGDGGNWIDPVFDREFRLAARVVDWCHASEHLWDCARAVHGAGTAAASSAAETLEAHLWGGRLDRVIAELADQAARLGPPHDGDPPGHPRRVLHQNVGYFTRHAAHMDYPRFRASGWPVGSGVTEAGVKQFNKRVKGTEQFWSPAGIEPILALRASWVSQDERWDRYWADRPAYVK